MPGEGGSGLCLRVVGHKVAYVQRGGLHTIKQRRNGDWNDTQGKGGYAAAEAVSLLSGSVRSLCRGFWDGSSDGI